MPFALTPATIDAATFRSLQESASLLGKLSQAMSDDIGLIKELHSPLVRGDIFFAELLSIHEELHADQSLPRVPLLIQRSDFMLDESMGPRLVECNSIAAGMAPFGEQAHHLHQYIRQQWPAEFSRFSSAATGQLVPNNAIARLSEAIVAAARAIRSEAGDEGAPTFVMVIQENEDNVFDQYLLERALRERGVRTFRRTFRELHAQLSSGPNERLMLKNGGAIDVVYLRAGYQYCDYIATDLDTRRCCDALRETRIFIERHRVAVNATVAQQLATSKRTQQYLSEASAKTLEKYKMSASKVQSLKAILAEMRSIDTGTADFLRQEGQAANWVLKNQGEGGGHCLFDEQIVAQLELLSGDDYAAWTLMRRLRPVARKTPTVIIRNGVAERVEGLVSELGLFTAHLAGRPLLQADETDPAYLGYLIRSKPPTVTEGGIHSGSGVLDSLIYN
ncbi:MAG: glutathione synthase [Proteobacteria bacterium]|nr:glutathione synthase [Pseudomonadota bacterium]